MGKRSYTLLLLFGILCLSACAAQQSVKPQPTVIPRDEHAQIERRQIVAPVQVVVPSHQLTPTPTSNPTPIPIQVPPTQKITPTPQQVSNLPTGQPSDIPNSGPGASPYGAVPPMTAQELQLTRQLFTIINADRAARNLYAFEWSPVLSGGARLHSWNMYHCGFSHTCPDGLPPCTRVMKEGFPDQPVCGECIGYAGPYPTAYDGMHTIQESMVNEPLNGYHAHRDTLLSTQFHKVGVGLYVDPSGFIWFTEDMLMR